MTRTATALALALVASPASAYEPERAMANLASDLAECAAYFWIASNASEETNAELSDALISRANNLRLQAIAGSNEKVTNARVNLAASDMLDELDGNFSNMAILIEQHQERCVEIGDDPRARYNYWIEKD